jgi:transcriptional regulator with XRE-family HTH domain
LADDTGLSRSTVSRLIRGLSEPSFAVAAAITNALEKQSKQSFDPRELLTIDSFKTQHVCKLVGCPGCLPDEAFNEDNELKPEFKSIRPGAWSGNVIGASAKDEDPR